MTPRDAVDNFFKAFNDRDNEGLRNSFHYPHILIGASGKALVSATPADFTMDFDFFADAEGWHHTTVESVRVLQQSSAKVHFEVSFTRHREDGTDIAQGGGIWIVTKEDDKWGVQARSLYGA